jgi:hypothetical protein
VTNGEGARTKEKESRHRENESSRACPRLRLFLTCVMCTTSASWLWESWVTRSGKAIRTSQSQNCTASEFEMCLRVILEESDQTEARMHVRSPFWTEVSRLSETSGCQLSLLAPAPPTSVPRTQLLEPLATASLVFVLARMSSADPSSSAAKPTPNSRREKNLAEEQLSQL